MRELLEFWLFIAFVGMLLILRFDAARFAVAEYDDEARDSGWRGWLRRLSFYALGVALVLLIYAIHPQPITTLHLDLGTDRQQALLYGLLFGLGGTLVAFGFAWYRYRRFRLPSARAYPGAIINSVGTAFIDEAVFRGVILGLLLSWGWAPALAIAFETILYGLATRLGAPGRSRAMLLISLGVGAVAGLLVLETLGIGAAILGHAITRFAIFLATGHAGSVRPPGWEPEELASWALPPSGWDIVSEADEGIHAPQLPAGAAAPAGFRLPQGVAPATGDGPAPAPGTAPPGWGGPPPGYAPAPAYAPPPGYAPAPAYAAPPTYAAPPPGWDGPPPGWGGPPPDRTGPTDGDAWGPDGPGDRGPWGPAGADGATAGQGSPVDVGAYGPPPGWYGEGSAGPGPGDDPWASPPDARDAEPRRG